MITPNMHYADLKDSYLFAGIAQKVRKYGEANPDKDPETAKGNKLIGKYITNLDWLTGLSRFLEGGGIIIICIVLTVLCSFCMVASILVKSSRKDPEKSSEEMTKSVAGNQEASDEPKE